MSFFAKEGKNTTRKNRQAWLMNADDKIHRYTFTIDRYDTVQNSIVAF